VTIRDIAASAGVSVGLIYKYFPGGKFDIIACIGSRYVEEQLVMRQPESINFNDFPGYVRALIKNMQQFSKLNSSWMKAVATAAARDSEIADEMRKVDLKEYGAVFELFDRFSRR
jgi:AcrR family transcriptional regulator